MKRYWLFFATTAFLLAFVAWLALSSPPTLIPDRGWNDWLVSDGAWSANDLMLATLGILVCVGVGAFVYSYGAEWLELRSERRRQR